MATNDKPPAERTYRVWADHVRRMSQEVEAPSPQQAHEIAQRHPEDWQDCFEHEDRDDYRLSNEVQDIETEQYHTIRGTTHCKTCGSEIVETVNGSNFHDGECGPCEYGRYRSQPDLLSAGRTAHDVLSELSYFPPFRENSNASVEGNKAIRKLARAINAAHGNAA